jgi:hypothetical protein
MSFTSAAQTKQTDARNAARRDVSLPATLRQDILPLDIEIVDVSATGFRGRSAETIGIGRQVNIRTVGIGLGTAEVVWARAPEYGFRFERELPPSLVRSIRTTDNVEVLPVAVRAVHPRHAEATQSLVEIQYGLGGIIKSMALATAALAGAVLRVAPSD